MLNDLLEQLPENLHLVIASRSEPPLPLARLPEETHADELAGVIAATRPITAAASQEYEQALSEAYQALE